MKPKIELLLDEKFEEFNKHVKSGRIKDLRNTNLAGMDLRKVHLRGLDLSGCYFRNANMSGLDLTGCNLFGASLRGANISGVLFPDNIRADEIRLSVEYGTRIRVTSG